MSEKKRASRAEKLERAIDQVEAALISDDPIEEEKDADAAKLAAAGADQKRVVG
jgi:hypothetical protein